MYTKINGCVVFRIKILYGVNSDFLYFIFPNSIEMTIQKNLRFNGR